VETFIFFRVRAAYLSSVTKLVNVIFDNDLGQLEEKSFGIY